MENKRLCRSSEDKVILGICGGIAKYFNIDPTIVRIIFGVGIFVTGITLVIYIICMFVMPPDSDIQ